MVHGVCHAEQNILRKHQSPPHPRPPQTKDLYVCVCVIHSPSLRCCYLLMLTAEQNRRFLFFSSFFFAGKSSGNKGEPLKTSDISGKLLPLGLQWGQPRCLNSPKLGAGPHRTNMNAHFHSSTQFSLHTHIQTT